MAVMLLDPYWADKVLAEREASGVRVRDEVWDGVTFIMPEPDNEHYDLSTFLVWVLRSIFDPSNGDRVGGPANVSDRERNWKRNYRVPDVSVFLAGNPAQDRRTHWYGGPDLAVEIVSPGDRSRDKLEFYAGVGTREVMILERDPWHSNSTNSDAGACDLRAQFDRGTGRHFPARSYR